MSREYHPNPIFQLEREYHLRRLEESMKRQRYESRGHLIGLGVSIITRQLTHVALTGLNPNMYRPKDGD